MGQHGNGATLWRGPKGQLPAVTRQPPMVTRQPLVVTRQPTAVTRQPPGVARQPPAVTHRQSQFCGLFFGGFGRRPICRPLGQYVSAAQARSAHAVRTKCKDSPFDQCSAACSALDTRAPRPGHVAGRTAVPLAGLRGTAGVQVLVLQSNGTRPPPPLFFPAGHVLLRGWFQEAHGVCRARTSRLPILG